MLQRITVLAIAAPRRVLAVTALLMLIAGVFAVPVTKSLSPGGFQDPSSESSRATQLLAEKFGQSDVQVIFMVTAADGVRGPAARAAGADIAGVPHPRAGGDGGGVGLDGATGGRGRPHQRRRQVGTGRRGDFRG